MPAHTSFSYHRQYTTKVYCYCCLPKCNSSLCSDQDKTIKYLVTDSDTITNKTDIAETLATSFAAKSSPDHYQEKFRKIRDKEKENTLDFESDNDEKYNVNFSKRELIKSITQATDSATGPDEIHYQFLKHLPDVSLDLLLFLLNDLWQSQDFPDGWREATVIPIPKPVFAKSWSA